LFKKKKKRGFQSAMKSGLIQLLGADVVIPLSKKEHKWGRSFKESESCEDVSFTGLSFMQGKF
jgi:hypothetical protein